MMVCATSSTIRNPAPPRPLLLSMAITAASRPARRRSAPTSVVALDRQKARLGYAGNTHRQPTQPDRGPARRLIWPAKPGQLRNLQLSSNSDFVGRIPKDGDDPTGFPIRVDERRPVEAIAAIPTDRKRGIGLLDMDCFELAVSGEPCGQLIRAVEQPCITGVS